MCQSRIAWEQPHTNLGTFKVEENSRIFQGLALKFKDFSRKNGIQGLSRTSPTVQGLFKTMRTLQTYNCQSLLYSKTLKF